MEQGGEIELDGAVPLFRPLLFGAPGGRGAGVVHEHVDASERVVDLRERALAFPGDREVGGERLDACARCLRDAAGDVV